MTLYYSSSNSGFYDTDFHKILPSDKVEITPAYHKVLLEGQSQGKVISHNSNGEPVLIDVSTTLEEKIKLYDNALTSFIDAAAQSLKYTNIYTAISFRNDPNPKFAAEAEALFLWRSEVWTYVNELLATELVTLNSNPQHILPTPEQVINSLPAFVPPTL